LGRRERRIDALASFSKAVDCLTRAKQVSTNNIDAWLALGLVYEEMALISNEPSKELNMALREFETAFLMDDSHLEACMKLTNVLFNRGDEVSKRDLKKRISRGLELTARLQDNINGRLGSTSDEYAKNWLHKRLEEARIWEENFKSMQERTNPH
jgi:tetratricopeptide (TPR) repeat protein